MIQSFEWVTKKIRLCSQLVFMVFNKTLSHDSVDMARPDQQI